MNDVIVSGTIESLEPPVAANPAAGVKGRKNYKVTASGVVYYAKPEVGASLQIGTTYTMTTSLQSFDGGGSVTWLNSATPGQGQPQQQSQAPQQQQRAQPQSDRDRNRSIITQCAGKAGHAADGTFNRQGAEDFLKWYFHVMGGGGWVDLYQQAMGTPAPQPQPEPVQPDIQGDSDYGDRDMDQPIPF
jgi:hypothetical protein